MTLTKLIREILERRYKKGVSQYRVFHPENPPYWSMEQIWTESEDWDDMVKPHKEALSLVPLVVSEIKSILNDSTVLSLDEEHIGYLIDSVLLDLQQSSGSPHFLLQGIIQPYGNTSEGKLVRAMAVPWRMLVDLLIKDWKVAYNLPYHKWEELIAGAFDRAGYDEVTLTPRSGDHGRDVIALKKGIGSIRIIGSVKAYKPGNLVRYDDIRALAGVLLGDQQATKGIVTTTSDFPPEISEDPFLNSLMPYRLELMNGTILKQWLEELALMAP